MTTLPSGLVMVSIRLNKNTAPQEIPAWRAVVTDSTGGKVELLAREVEMLVPSWTTWRAPSWWVESRGTLEWVGEKLVVK